MKKQICSVLFLLLIFLLAGFGCGKSEELKSGEKGGIVKEDGGLIDDFKDALRIKQKMECTYKVNDQGQPYEYVSYIEGDKYRSEYSADGVNSVSIFDGKTMYTWDENTRQGTKLDIACLDDLQTDDVEDKSAGQTEDYDEYQSSEEMLSTGFDISCRKVASIDFTIPDDVQLIDQCALLKQQMQVLDNLQNQMPDFDGFDF